MNTCIEQLSQQTMSTLKYEEAISSLKDMFGAKWKEELLDAVVEHHGMHIWRTRWRRYM